MAASVIFTKTVTDVEGRGPAGLVLATGDIISYSISVTNDGDEVLTGASVSDPLLGTLTQTVGDDFDNELGLGETWTYTGTYTVSQSDIDGNGIDSSGAVDGDGDIDNLASFESDQLTGQTAPAAAYLGETRDIDISKTVLNVDGGPPLSNVDEAGDVITYQIVVENTGGATLTNVVVSDPFLGALTQSGGENDDDGILSPGETWTYTGTYEVMQSDIDANGNVPGEPGRIDNTAHVSSTEIGNSSDSARVDITYDPVIAIDKTITAIDDGSEATGNANNLLDTAGDVVEYAVKVTNTGNVTLTNVMVTDPLTGLDETIPSLAPDESMTFDTQYAITQEDLNTNGNIENTATANPDQVGPVTDSESEPLITDPGLEIDKRVVGEDADGDGILDAVGDLIEYKIDVKNTGNVDLTNVVVTDTLLGGPLDNVAVTGDDENIGVLDVGETWTYSGNYALTQDDLDGYGNVGPDGNIVNTATVDSDQTGSSGSSTSTPVVTTPPPEECVLLTQKQAWAWVAGNPWAGGTPGTDDADFKDLNGIEKGKAFGGDDHVAGNENANTIIGNAGKDLVRGDAGDDFLFGNKGNDVLLGDEAPSALDPNPDQGNDQMTGGSGNDVLAGGGGNDVSSGGAGNDLLIEGAGNDCQSGNDGNDVILGGSGNDMQYGDAGDDCIAGQDGRDLIKGGDGNDTISGGKGGDSIYGNTGNDYIGGGAGGDYINGGTGDDNIWGGAGNDTIRGYDGNDNIDGGTGDDGILGQRGDDLIFGRDGVDTIQGGGGNDRIDGGNGADVIEGNDNADCINGGDGNDTIYGDNMDAGQPALGEASDLIDGGAGHDEIHGGEDDDQVYGNVGDDDIFGDTGDDVLSGGLGRDTISGGEGKDHISGGRGKDDLSGDAGDDVMDGGSGRDTMSGGKGDDCMDGGSGRDIMQGNNGKDTMDGGSGRDTVDGGKGDDFVYGNSGNDLLFGDRGQDNGGSDTLLGGIGDDRLHGGMGKDCLIADEGADTLWGEGDGDDFVFGHDVDANGDEDCDDEEDYTSLDIGDNVIMDFDDDQEDRVVFHSDFEGTLSSTLDGDDVIVTSSLGGSVRIVGLVSEMEGIDPTDDYFDEAAVMEFLLQGGEDGDGKGIIDFHDKCVTLPDCNPDTPETGWEGQMPRVSPCCRDLSIDKIGNTTVNTTELEIANLYVEQDANVSIHGEQLCINIYGEASE